MKIIAILVSLFIFFKGIQKNNNILFWGGLCMMIIFLMWKFFDIWVEAGTFL